MNNNTEINDIITLELEALCPVEEVSTTVSPIARNNESDFSTTNEEFVASIIDKPTYMSEIVRKRSNRGRKRKADNTDLDAISDEERRKREYNNRAVRRSRDKAKQRQQKIETNMMNLVEENGALKNAVKRRDKQILDLSREYDRLKSYVNNIMPLQLVPNWINEPLS